jgi:hypothetical protein
VHRKALAVLWLGEELPTWPRRCPIRVKLTDRGVGGATAFAFDNGKVLSQDMQLEGALDTLLADILPHEVAHTIVAHWYGKPVPRWADEGVAGLAEGQRARARYEQTLLALLKEGRMIPLRRLLPMREYPQDVMALFAQGYSLTAYLVGEGGHAKFLAFVKQGERDGWDRAAKKHYGHKTVDDLERDWLQSVRKNASRGEKATRVVAGPGGWSAPHSSRTGPKGQLPAGPAPVQVLASLGRDGRLTVWHRETTYQVKQVHKTHSGAAPPPPPVKVTVAVTTVVPKHHDPKDVKVFDTRGKAIDPKKLPELLKKETPALVSADGQPVDALHLRLVKEGTLVFVLPAAPVVPPPAVPVPEAPIAPPLPIPPARR